VFFFFFFNRRKLVIFMIFVTSETQRQMGEMGFRNG